MANKKGSTRFVFYKGTERIVVFAFDKREAKRKAADKAKCKQKELRAA